MKHNPAKRGLGRVGWLCVQRSFDSDGIADPGGSERKVVRATHQAMNSQGVWDSESNQGFLATRKPMLRPALSGVLSVRYEERTRPGSLAQEPPRSTRDVPDTGPSGFVDGLTE